MRKGLLVLGIALLFIGIIATSGAANIHEEKIISREEVDRKTATMLENMTSWSVSGSFSKGEKLGVVIQPGRNWMGEPAPGYHYLILPVTIRDPWGDETKLKVKFTTDPFGIHPFGFDSVELVSDGGGLTFEKSDETETIIGTTYYQGISGIVNYDGVYNVTVHRAIGVFGPPEILKLERLLTEKVYPYWFVSPMGVGFMVAGVFLSILARKSPRHKRRLKASARAP